MTSIPARVTENNGASRRDRKTNVEAGTCCMRRPGMKEAIAVVLRGWPSVCEQVTKQQSSLSVGCYKRPRRYRHRRIIVSSYIFILDTKKQARSENESIKLKMANWWFLLNIFVILGAFQQQNTALGEFPFSDNQVGFALTNSFSC